MADVAVSLSWTGEGLQFDGGSEGGPRVRLDGNAKTGASPVQALLLAVGGCMAADIVDIAVKGRVPLTGLEVTVDGDRATDYPRRFTAIAMRFIARGTSSDDEPKLQRALEMSREKYCSVLHTIREDVAFEFHLEQA